MKIICEYCKNSIDTDKDEKCPNCNASYHNNKEFKERIEYLKREKDINLETRRLQNETFKTVLGNTKKVFEMSRIISLGIFIFAAIIMFVIVSSFSKNSQRRSDFHTTTTTTTTREVKVEANLGQYAETSKYQIMVDKVINIDKLYEVIKPSEGKTYKVFHIILKNKTDKRLMLSSHINCVVDEFAQKEVYYLSKYPGLPSFIDADLKAEGYVIFEVPTGSKSFDIKYGEYVTIHINEK